MPILTMFSMAASRQSLTSQTPQALKLGWLIAGLILAALLLLLLILVLVDKTGGGLSATSIRGSQAGSLANAPTGRCRGERFTPQTTRNPVLG